MGIKIVGISGKRAAGKSMLADFLCKDFGYVKVSLATPLKKMCQELYSLTDEEVYGERKEEPTGYELPNGKPLTPRDILIMEGCTKRFIDRDFWCKQLDNLIKHTAGTTFVVDDIRFKNEIAYLRKAYPGSKFIRLDRDEKDIGKPPINDPSECELDDYKEWDGLLLPLFNRVPQDLKTFAEYVAMHV